MVIPHNNLCSCKVSIKVLSNEIEAYNKMDYKNKWWLGSKKSVVLSYVFR